MNTALLKSEGRLVTKFVLEAKVQLVLFQMFQIYVIVIIQLP